MNQCLFCPIWRLDMMSLVVDCVLDYELPYNTRFTMIPCTIVYLCKYFPCSRAFSLMRANHRVYAPASHHTRGVVDSACAFLAYKGTHQVHLQNMNYRCQRNKVLESTRKLWKSIQVSFSSHINKKKSKQPKRSCVGKNIESEYN